VPVIARGHGGARCRIPIRPPGPGAASEEKTSTVTETIDRAGLPLFPGADPPASLIPPRPTPPGDPLPLSYGQRRMCLFEQQEPGTSANNVEYLAWLTGPLDRDALEWALTELHRRHEILRTRYPDLDRQAVDPPRPVAPREHDLSGAADPDAAADRLLAALAEEPFDLTRAAVGWHLVRLGPERHLLVTLIHHIAVDGWSERVINTELSVLYNARHAGLPSPLPDIPVQYGDYALWQRTAGTDPASSDYWRQAMAGAPGAVGLPFDRPASEHTSLTGRAVSTAMPGMAAATRAFARKAGASPFMVLQSVFAATLSRYSGSRDVVLGTPVAGRDLPELEELVGFFINTVPFRVDLAGDPSLRELVHQVRERSLDGYAHQDVPLDVLVEQLRPEREPGRQPLVQVLFQLHNTPTDSLALDGLDVRQEQRFPDSSKLDLSVTLTEEADGLSALWVYRHELFDPATIERLQGSYFQLLQRALEEPDRPLSRLPLLSDEEYERSVVVWNDTAADYPADARVEELFEDWARRAPERTAVIDVDGAATSYGELDARADQLAHFLQAEGAGPESIVAVCVQHSVDMFVALLGILKSGAAYVALDPTHPADRMAHILAETGARILISQREVVESGILPEGHCASVVRIDDDWHRIAQARPTGAPAERGGAGNLAYVAFTSGSTGRSKGVMVLHRSVVNFLIWAADAFGLRAGTGSPMLGSIAFDLSLPNFLLPFATGQAVTLLPADQPVQALAELLARPLDFSALKLTPGQLDIIRRSLPDGAVDSVGAFIVAGDVFRPQLVAEARKLAPNARFINECGPTETVVGCCVYEVTEADEQREIIPVGHPVANTRLYVLDEFGNPVPPGAAGELYIGGHGVSRGYLNRPGLTAERFVPDPFGEPGSRMYRTGDRMRWREDGELEFLGRIDFQVKIRGYRVELGEVEQCLLQLPGVAQAVVVARDDPSGARQLAAYLTSRPGAELDIDSLREGAAHSLPDYMVPSAWAVLDTLPINANGKIDTRRLPEITTEAAADRRIAPRTAVEKAIAGIWEEVLGVEDLGLGDDFFRLGGHSLLATHVVSRVARLFPGLSSRRLTGALLRRPLLSDFVAAVTDALMEAALEASQNADVPEPGVPLLDRTAPLPLSGGQQRMWFLEELGGGGAEYLVPIYLRLDGPLDVEALRRAVGEIVDRHEVLRTRVVAEGDELWGQVLPPGGFQLPVVEVRGAEEVERVLAQEAARATDLGAGHPVRGLLVRAGAEEHVLCLTAHHIACDGSSRRVLYRELAELYEAFRDGKPSPLAPLAFQYADYAAHHEARAADLIPAQLEFWRDRLEGRTPFEVPADLPRPTRRSAAGASSRAVVDRETLDRLTGLGARHGATLFMTLTAACQLVLSRYAGRTDVTLGTTASERHEADSEPLIGLFINMLVLPGDTAGNPTFAQLVARARDLTLDAYGNQDVTFDRLVEELAPERDMSRTPLFQIMVKLDEEASGPPPLAGLRVVEIQAQAPVSKYDLSFEFTRTADHLAVEVEYDTALYLPETARALAGHLVQVLRTAAAAPDTPIDDLGLVGAAEHARLQAVAEPPAVPYPDKCLHELIEEQAARTPDAPALLHDGGELTYRELDAWADRVAALVRGAGARVDDVVGVLVDRSPAMVAAVLGVLKAGCAYLPMEVSTPPERVAVLLRDSGAPACVVQPDLAGTAAGAGVQVLRMPDAQPDAAEPEPAAVSVGASPANLCAVYYTSGSTGKPKGVACPHYGWVSRMQWMQHAHGLAPGDVVLLKTTLTFDDVAVEMLWPLMYGAATAVLGPGLHRDPRAIIDAAIRYGACHLQFVPSMLELFLDELTDSDVERLGSLRTVLSAGDWLRPDLVGRFFEHFGDRVRLETLWGTTEAAIDSAQTWLTPAHAEAPTVPIGRPFDNNGVYVLDNRLDPIPFGVFGELHIAGAGLARGYLGDPARTAAAFLPHPYRPGERLYRTGDWGRVRQDGTVFIAGRRDDQVKIRGVRTELGEVEAAVRSHPAVDEVAITVWEPVPGDKRLALYLSAKAADTEIVDAVRARLQEILPVYAVPSSITQLPRLPRTSSGKLDRRALPSPQLTPDLDGYLPPEGPTETAVAEVFGQVLGIPQVGRNDDFFLLGGHSLLATRAIGRLRQAFGPTLPLSMLFERPTVAGTAARIYDHILGEIEEMSEEEAAEFLGQ
jgi:amino acid adenylation domain-containing protein